MPFDADGSRAAGLQQIYPGISSDNLLVGAGGSFADAVFLFAGPKALVAKAPGWSVRMPSRLNLANCRLIPATYLPLFGFPQVEYRAANSSLFRLAKHGDMPVPRPGEHSHHGAMSARMKANYSGYDPNKAPAILIPDLNHRSTFGVYNTWRAETRKGMGGVFDWTKVDEADMKNIVRGHV